MVLHWTLSRRGFTVNLLIIGHTEEGLYLFIAFQERNIGQHQPCLRKCHDFVLIMYVTLSVSCLPASHTLGYFVEEK